MDSTPQMYVIDPDPSLRDQISGILSRQGHTVDTYSTASDFLAKVAHGGWGVVACELSLPDMSGEDLQRRLKEINASLAVIVLTGAADVKTVVRLMRGGAATMLEKPFSDTELLAAVELGLAHSLAVHDERMRIDQIGRRLAELSEDERGVLRRMILGKPIKTCARELCCSTRTIERRRKAVLDAMGVASLPELAVVVEKFRAARPHCEGFEWLAELPG